jgi:hypothetical protein
MAIVHIAISDAVNGITGKYQSFTGIGPAPANASLDAAVAEAAHDALVALYPYLKPSFDAELATDLAGIPVAEAIAGTAFGSDVAQFLLAERANDGSSLSSSGQPVNYTYGQLPGQWRPDPLHPAAQPLGVLWGEVTPFVLKASNQFRAPAPPSLTSSAYASAYTEVKSLGALASTTRSQDQTNIGLFWAYDGQPNIGATPRLYNQIAMQVANQMVTSSDVSNLARLLALVNVSLADSAITVWESKYNYTFWGPITGIRENDLGTGPTGLGSGNPLLVGQGDPTFTPLGAPADNGNGTNFTPPFPSYPSAHAALGGTLLEILRKFYHRDNVRVTFVSDELNGVTLDSSGNVRPAIPRTFDSFSQAERQNGQSRIYLGVDWHFDRTAGIAQGRQVADYVFAHAFLPLD